MPAPALSGLAARPPPAPLRCRADPRAGGAAGRASHPPWDSGLRWVRPPRSCPARFCFPVTSSLRTGLCRTGRPGSSSHPSPPGPGSSPGASPGSAPPGPAAGTAQPAPDGTRRDGTGWGTQPPAGLPRPQNGGSRFAPPPSAVFVCVPGMAEPAAARAPRGGTGRDGSGDPAAPGPARLRGLCGARDLPRGSPAGGSPCREGVPHAGKGFPRQGRGSPGGEGVP
ncbi:collagen alpha-1(III) chain-like [Ammospiza caudacuta]|uniref:collagen alpha-1(III) chain-like n=1 Tax=Ammospiza caudacuta TaxID=2857398 RepID=UPI002739ABB8|nr:collagen alpha-1(III) chain-like [Ammospiza caudacuta]